MARGPSPMDVLPSVLRSGLQRLQDSALFEPVGFVLRVGYLFYKALQEDLAFVRAAGMAYASLMALVPLLVLVFGVLGAVGALSDPARQEAVYDALFGTFFGDVAEIRVALEPFLTAIDFGALGAVSTLVLLVVAARLFMMVERAYSDIFRVRMKRSMPRRVLNFYFSITAVPVVLVLSLEGALELGMSGLQGVVVAGAQFVLLVAALKSFPCTHVRWGPALGGAFTSWMLLQLGGKAFTTYIAWSYADPDYALRAFYGSLILIPIFLFWLYTFWIVLLLGVEVAHLAQDYDTLLDAEMEARQREGRTRSAGLANVLETLAHVALRFERGDGPSSIDVLHESTHLARWDLAEITDTLRDAGLIVESNDGWVPARPPEQIDLAEVARSWREHTRLEAADAIAEEVGEASGLTGSLEDAMRRWYPG